jgi:FdhE protein
MGYAALPEIRREVRQALADLWWQRIEAANPQLSPAIALQKRLLAVVRDLSDTLSARGVSRLSLPAGYLTAKLRSGIPALAGEPVQVPTAVISPSLVALCRALADGDPGEAAVQLLAAIEGERLDHGALLTLTLRREQAALRIVAAHAGIGHDLLWLVADLAVSPFAHLQLRRLFDHVDPNSTFGVVLAHWTRGYCPLCGSWPGLTERVDGRLLLRCGFCAAAWDAPSASCVYCGNNSDGITTFTPDPSRPERTFYGCAACHGYGKTMAADRLTPFPLLAIADLDSMDLDLAAMNAGFARPALKQFGRR